MARPIDEKIVAMKMDNSDFKRKAIETTSLFGKLTNSLNKIPGVNLSKIANGFSGISRAANSVTLGGLGRAIDTISQRFSTLGVIATTALVNISNRAIDAGINLVKSLGMDQIITGFQEYELKIGSIGTVLSNTEWAGTGLSDVNRVFGELNDYADQTIYNFAQMTQNIGRFTAAGVKLEDSATAIKGLGNLAAISGSNTEQLNTAMYQMSQALASGKLNLMDWNSLVNAGMAGKKTQDALLATAKAMGKNVDLSEGFRNSISDGWLTSEIFLETLKKFGEDESMTEAATKVRTFSQMIDTLKEGIGSGWATSWEIIFGDFEESTKLWTGVSDFFGGFFQKQADARNKFLRTIFDNGGLSNLMAGFMNIIAPVGQIFSSIGDGFRKAFPPSGAKEVSGFIETFKNLTSGLKLSEGTVNNLKTIFEGFFSIFAIGWKIVKGAVGVIIGLLPSFSELGAKVIELIARVFQVPKAFNEASDSSEAFGAALEVLKVIAAGISSVLIFVIDGLLHFADAVAAAWNILAKGDFKGGPWEEDSYIVDKLFTIRETVVEVVNGIKEAWGILLKGDFSGKGPWEEDSAVVDWLFRIREGLVSFGTAIKNLDFSWEPIAKAFNSLVESLKRGYTWLVETFSGLGEKISNAMPSGDQLIAGGFIAALVSMVGLAVKMAWDFYNVFTGWGKIGDGITEVLEAAGGALDAFALQVKSQALLTAAIAIGILAGSFLVMGNLDAKQIANGLYAMIGSMTALVTALAIMTKYDITGTGLAATTQIVALSVAFAILSVALRSISDLSWGEITKGIIGLVGVMGAFSGALVLMTRFGGPSALASSAQFLAIAISVRLIVGVLDDIASIETGKLIKGLTGLAVALGILAGALVIMSRFGGASIGASALQLVAISASIMIMVAAINQIADINVSNLTKGLTTIALILAAIAAFVVVTRGPGVMGAGAGLVLLATALNLMLIPIAAFGSMSLETLAKGLGAMAVALVAIGAASMLMTGMVAAGAGLILVAAGLNLLLVPITALSLMSLGALAVGIGALAAGILLIGGAAAVLGLAGPALLIGAAGIAALGIAMLAAGAGVALFATGLVTLATMTVTAVGTIVAFIGTLIVGLASLIPTAVKFIGDLVTQMAATIANKAPQIANSMSSMILAMLEVAADKIPKFAKVATDLVTGFMDAISEYTPKLAKSAINMVISMIEAMADTVAVEGPRFRKAILQLMAEVLIVIVQTGAEVVGALFGWIPGVTEAANAVGKTAEQRIRESFGAAEAGRDKGTDFSKNLAGRSGDAKSAGSKVGKAGEAGVTTGDYSGAGKDNGSDYTAALARAASAAKTSGKSVAEGGKRGAGSVSMSSTGHDFGKGFAGGIGRAYEAAKTAAKGLALRAASAVRNWLVIKSPSRVMRIDGGWFGEGFALGISDKTKTVEENAKGLAMSAKESLNKFIEGFQLPEEDNELHFKAVIDYDSLDPNRFGNVTPLKFATSTTQGLLNAAINRVRQNGNTSREERSEKSITYQNQYEINLTANGVMDRAAVSKLVDDVEAEIKSRNDRARISRGEEVVF